MKEVCAETNMTYQTLKYYCNEGLVPNVKRDKNNHRIFDEKELEESIAYIDWKQNFYDEILSGKKITIHFKMK